ncbi:MAG: hypothetical protein A2W35_08275 [Chloroflexi bacterium RBG_16_57_11]|nr:MAG: hypothetical protein A2W35_08275 [Chloroflexi bacterium RBG_16_57_11]
MNKNLVFARRFQLRRGLVFGVIIVTALFAFEMFNFSTTEFALEDLLGDLSFAGISWATILAIAFCGIDFAGIARLFTPTDHEKRQPAQNEAWYLFGAWLLAATMNAMLTWWGVSLAILERQDVGNAVASREVILRAVPVFVAVLVWLIRVLIIGTFSVAGDRLFSQDDQRIYSPSRANSRPVAIPAPATVTNNRAPAFRSASAGPNNTRSSKMASSPSYEGSYIEKPEPTYHPVSARPSSNSTYGSSASRTPVNQSGNQLRS